MGTPFGRTSNYVFKTKNIACEAFLNDNKDDCASWLAGPVALRVYDQASIDALKEDVLALQSEGFDISNLEKYTELPASEVHYWDIGESIADLFLIERLGVHLPSNRRRDLRTPKGSLPGADIVGYAPDGNGGATFVFGEIKASTEANAPPSVMANTGSGMVAQLERLTTSLAIQRQLMYYLRDRSKETELQRLYKLSLQSLADKKFKLIGVLVRDTQPNLKDVEGPACSLSAKLGVHQPCTLYVLHTGIAAPEWSLHCKAT